MYALIRFDISSETDGLRYPLPPALDVAILDDTLAVCAQEQLLFPEMKHFSDEGLLGCWHSTLTVLLELLSTYEKRIFLFPTNRHLILFHNIKRRLKLHTKSSNNGSLEAVAHHSSDILSLEEMIIAIQAIGPKALASHPDIFPHAEKSGHGMRDNMLKHSSFCYMADITSGLYHKLDSNCLERSDPAHWRGLGKDPRHSGFRPCPVCIRTAPRSSSSTRKPASRSRYKSKAETMREQLVAVSKQYGLHAEVVGGMAYITTIAGEWYFNYNDRPIKLHHKNAETRYDRDGNPTGQYHTQPMIFHAPLQALTYIRNHEQAEIKRQMDALENE